MLTFLFWNLGRANLTDAIVRLAERHEVDIFIFAECAIPPVSLLLALNPAHRRAEFHYAPGRVPGRLEFFTRFDRQFIEPIREEHRYTIRRVFLPGRDELLIAAVHLISPLHTEEYDRDEGARLLAEEIREVERDRGHDRTIAIGDFNLNPFDNGIVAATALHGVMSQEIARRGTRTVQRREYPFFYNPMWSKLGEHPDRPHGTYYYGSSGQVCYFWNAFDQVLIRPSLLDFWDDRELQILITDGALAFTDERGFPDRENASDHLPILFRLDI